MKTQGSLLKAFDKFNWIVCVVLVLNLVCCIAGTFSQTTKPNASPQTKQQKKTPFVKKMLRILGITATTSQQKSDDDVESGTIWICPSTGGSAKQIMSQSGFRSPIFLPSDKEILALSDGQLVRITITTGIVTKLAAVANSLKIIGYEKNNPQALYLLVTAANKQYNVIKLQLNTKEQTTISFDPDSTQDQDMIYYISNWQRDYGDTRVFVQKISNFAKMQEWQHVFIQHRDGQAIDLTKEAEHKCAQPALSNNKQWVIYIRVEG